jgi:hypothetical protein
MSAGNDDLHPILSKIHETLGDVLAEVQRVVGEVRKVRETAEEGFATVHDAIRDSIQAQAELKMMDRVAEVRAIVPQISAELDRVEEERAELDQRLEQIGERYERRHAELDETAAERVRDLGSHIFEIDEEQFEAGIESPFTDNVTTTWAALQSHNDTVESDRRDTVEMSTGDAVQSIHGFVDQQRELLDRIDRHRSDVGWSLSETTPIQIPYYVVNVEVDGRTERHVVVPSELDDGDGATGVELTSMSGLDDLVTPTPVADPTETRLSSADLRERGESYFTDAPPLLSYGAAAEDALDDGLSVTVEGGES